jgi:hypothetical protein
MNPTTHKWYAVAAGLLVIVIVVGWYFVSRNKALAPSSVGTIATSTNTTPPAKGGTSTVSIANTSDIPMPSLDRPYNPPSDLPASVQALDRQQVATAIQQLTIDPNHLAYWLQLAIYRKGAGDYTGAEEIWVYCTKRWPTDYTSFENLGDLYANYLHKSTLAVQYWRQALTLAPRDIRTYISLATYQDINLQDKAAAQATLEAGLQQNPGNTDLQRALANLQ